MIPDEYRTFISELATESGEFIRLHYGRKDLGVEMKADESPVTLADKGAEQLLRQLIDERFPNHGVIGEEFGNYQPDAEWVWVLDPIDGTKSFVSAVPLFGTLIALMHGGQPVLGAIHQPILNQLVIGDGKRTTLNGAEIRIRDVPTIEAATLLTSDPLNPGKFQRGPNFEVLQRRAKMSRTWGDCYGYLLLASGWADIVVDPIMNPWDIQALIPIVRGAGGVITDWHGRDPVKSDSIVAAGPLIHAEVIEVLNR